MDMVIDENKQKQMHKMLQDLASFMALYEQADDRFKAQNEELEKHIANIRHEIQGQLSEVKAAVDDIQEVMDAAGAARWRVAAEKAMKAGDDHLKAMKETCNIYKKLAEDSVSRLEHLSASTERRITGALKRLHEDNFSVVEDFRRQTEESYVELDQVADQSIGNIKRLMRWLRFDRIVIAILTALLTAFFTSSYINAEFPWASHATSAQERVVGRTLLTVWPTLSKTKQDEINQLLGRTTQSS